MENTSKKLTPLQEALLSAYRNGESLSLGDLANRLNTSKSAVQRARDSLAAKKFIVIGKWKNRTAGKPPVAAKIKVIAQ